MVTIPWKTELTWPKWSRWISYAPTHSWQYRFTDYCCAGCSAITIRAVFFNVECVFPSKKEIEVLIILSSEHIWGKFSFHEVSTERTFSNRSSYGPWSSPGIGVNLYREWLPSSTFLLEARLWLIDPLLHATYRTSLMCDSIGDSCISL